MKSGELATGALVISALSGFAVAYQYEVADPFVSCVAIEGILPYGAFWRSLHFWSSQAFFLLLLYHTIDTIHWPLRHKGMSHRRHWSVMGLCLPAALFTLFTGYVLRYDGTGQAACNIAEHLLLEVPLIGEALERFFMGTSSEGLNRVYVVHILLTVILWGLGTWYHLKRVTLSWHVFRDILAAAVVFCALVAAPMDLPGRNVELIKGPWFFLGVQELLRYLPPFLAGVLFPLTPLAVICAIPWIPRPRTGFWIIGAWTLAYGYLTLVAILR